MNHYADFEGRVSRIVLIKSFTDGGKLTGNIHS